LYKDFKKCEFEAVATEVSYVISNLKTTIKNIEKWTEPKMVLPSLINFPSTDYVYKEPFGNVLIISPWNYPFQLAFCPLIAAVAAGNKVVLKPSELTPYTATITAKIIRESFDNKHVIAILGDATIAKNLLEQRWDFIFFTGSVKVGKIIAATAAKNLTPVVLELGGKNPCIVEQTAKIGLAAKRIVWGKFLNAGQTCIAPDYVLVHQSIKKELIKALILEIKNAYGENIKSNKDFPRIINQSNWKRLVGFLNNENILYGGEFDEFENYLAPTLLDNPNIENDVMKDEIFGPILPILSYESMTDLDKIILRFEKPLSLYVFSTNKNFADKIIQKYSFGGGCVNDVVLHFSNHRLPFGGVGHSGIGAYHGKLSFDAFCHKK
jgi:aldehyde dehydrogenase (NAD+)